MMQYGIPTIQTVNFPVIQGGSKFKNSWMLGPHRWLLTITTALVPGYSRCIKHSINLSIHAIILLNCRDALMTSHLFFSGKSLNKKGEGQMTAYELLLIWYLTNPVVTNQYFRFT